MWMMSRKPLVVMRPTSAPLCSMMMFVATVVPWKNWSIPAGSAAGGPAELERTLHGRGGRVGRRRRHLVHVDAALVVEVDQVGERATDVDAEALHRPRLLRAGNAPRGAARALLEQRQDCSVERTWQKFASRYVERVAVAARAHRRAGVLGDQDAEVEVARVAGRPLDAAVREDAGDDERRDAHVAQQVLGVRRVEDARAGLVEDDVTVLRRDLVEDLRVLRRASRRARTSGAARSGRSRRPRSETQRV